MNCEYSSPLEPDEFNRHFLFCKIEKNKCPLIRFCSTIRDIKNIDGYEGCTVKNDYIDKKDYSSSTPNKVLFEKNGMLYVENGDFTESVKNPYLIVPKYVKLLKSKNGEYYVK